MSLAFHEIVESRHRILNPFTHEKLMLLGSVCRILPGMRHLDLACGKGEMLCQWAKRYGSRGVGVDVSADFLAAANARAGQLRIAESVTFVRADASSYETEPASFDMVSCIGATWIGGGLVGTLDRMKPPLRDGGLLLVGEPYWIDPPPAAAYEALDIGREEFTTLDGTLARAESAGTEPVEMVLADQDDWDRYVAAQWMTGSDWLEKNPDDPRAGGLRDWIEAGRRAYLRYGRRYLGWGVFVLRVRER